MPSLVSEGLTLMALGMGTVFVFLTVLVMATLVMSTVLMRWTPAEIERKATPTGSNRSVDPELLQVLKAAVDTYRIQKK